MVIDEHKDVTLAEVCQWELLISIKEPCVFNDIFLVKLMTSHQSVIFIQIAPRETYHLVFSWLRFFKT